mgnify:CR=1 FL=1
MKQLEDLDYADDIVLLSHKHQMQKKTSLLNTNSLRTGLRIHKGKTKIQNILLKNSEPVLLDNDPLQTTNAFNYLGSIINETGDTDNDVTARIGKARTAFQNLNNIWRSNLIRRKTKIKIFNSNVKAVLLYGSETWQVTKHTMKTLQTFINRSSGTF